MKSRISWVAVTAILGALACSLTPAQPPPEIIPPTVRPTDAPVVVPTSPPPDPTSGAATAVSTSPPSSSTQAQAPVIPPWPVLQQGSQGPNVAALQYLLRHHGQDIPADGLFGPVTKQAVMNLQTQKGLVVDGMVGAQTWPALVAGLVIQNGSGGDAVRAAQHLLHEKYGYPDVVVDGLFGPMTEAAVRDYQLQYGLVVDGIVGPEQTWPSLISDAP